MRYLFFLRARGCKRGASLLVVDPVDDEDPFEVVDGLSFPFETRALVFAGAVTRPLAEAAVVFFFPAVLFDFVERDEAEIAFFFDDEPCLGGAKPNPNKCVHDVEPSAAATP